MVTRDEGPKGTLGFGVSQANLPREYEQRTVSSERGALAQYFEDKPVAAFFATAIGAMVGGAVAGSLVRKGGTRLLHGAANSQNNAISRMYSQNLMTFRKIQKTLDEYSGTYRRYDGDDPLSNPLDDFDEVRKGFIFSAEERKRIAEMGYEAPEMFTLRDEYQQRLVRMARRAPYELTGAYVFDQTILHPTLGVGDDDRKINLTNPFDAIGDFANETAKNLAFGFLPFEGGTATIKHTYQKNMYRAAMNNTVGGMRPQSSDLLVDLNTSLKLVGAQFGDMVSQSMRYSQRGLGSLATAITDTAQKTRSLPQSLEVLAKSSPRDTINRAREGSELPTIFGQLRNVARVTKREWNAWESAGDVRSRGTSKFERFVNSVFELQPRAGDGGRLEGGGFYTKNSRAVYGKFLEERLVANDVEAQVAQRVVRAGRYTTSTDPEVAFSRRFRFGNDDRSGPQSIAQQIEQTFGIGNQLSRTPFTGPKANINVLHQSLLEADDLLKSSRDAIQDFVRKDWNELYAGDLSREIRKGLGARKAAYADFEGALNGDKREYLVRQAARRAGLDTENVSTSQLRKQLKSERGIDANNYDYLRTYLVDKGDISKPWNPQGYNMLGFRAVTVQEALDEGYFDDSRRLSTIHDVARTIQRTDYESYLASQTRVGGLYRSSSGTLLDLNPLIDGARKALGVIGDEIKVPFIQVRPLQLFGLSNYQAAIREGPIRYSANQNSSMIPGSGQRGVFFFQDGPLGRGRLRGYTPGQGRLGDDIAGKYAPISTRASTVYSSLLKLATGESGEVHAPDTKFRGLKQLFDVAPRQDGSIFDLGKRIRNARRVGGVAGTAEKILGSDEVFRDWIDQVDSQEAKEFFDFLRRGAVSPAVRRYGNRGHLGEMFAKIGGNQSVYDMNERQLIDYLGELRARSDSDSDLVTRLRRDILPTSRYDENITEAKLREITTSQRRVSRITTKADELRADMVRLQAIESGLNSPAGFSGFVKDAMSELDDLQRAGKITAKERAEASLSLASMAQTYESAVKFDRTEEVLKSYRQTIRSIRQEVQRPESGIREALNVVAKRQDAGALAQFKRFFGWRGDDSFLSYDVFEDDVQFVQTFGTAFSRLPAGIDPKDVTPKDIWRNPLRAVSSMLGIQSWGPKNAEHFSLATMTTSNLVTRLNRGLGMLGGKLDESAYHGPMDLLFRGMIGKRALPAYAAGAAFMTVDRTLGGLVNDRDAAGDRVYSPLLLGGLSEIGVRAQALGSGLMPGGLGYQEKLEQLTEGEVAIRSGRYWILGNTPWKGGKIDYFGPSWYRRMQSGYQYTDQTYGSPMERFLYGYDFSPLRPIDPYRFEKRTAEDRPYPQSGDYFTGPFGPVTPILNATAGRILKPRVDLNPAAMQAAQFSTIPQGQYGAAPAMWDYYEQAAGQPAYDSGSAAAPGVLENWNNRYVSAATTPAGIRGGPDTRMNFASGVGRNVGVPGSDVEMYLAAASTPAYLSGSKYASAMVMASNNPANQIFMSGQPISSGDIGYQASELAYTAQEFAGIYGFGFSALRSNLGMGGPEYNPMRPVMASPSDAYGFSRQFWGMNLGGLGDFPTPLEGQYANLEISELVRRFVPRPRDRTYNPIPNSMNYKAPWLPGGEGIIDFKTGDPYTKITQGELRLPGKGYERLNNLAGGNYSQMDQLRILADVAPYSSQYRSAVSSFRGTAAEMREVEMIRQQVEAQTRRYDFTEYEDRDPSGGFGSLALAGMAGAAEKFRHMDTYFHRKFIAEQSALEHWERTFVYGSAFPEWGSPIESFVKPAYYKAGDRNPASAALGLGLIGSMMGATHRARGALRVLGAVTGAGFSIFQNAREAITGEKYIPEDRKREIAFEQYADTLQYVKSRRNFEIARAAGDARGASLFKQQMKSTMYGADIYGSTAEELALALPKRKREHFMTMINEESSKKREQILSTAGVLERRIYQAAWGMRVEERPDLAEYFEDKELPSANWEGWSPSIDMQDVVLKSLQHEGLNASQMGYYPEELQRANLINPSFPVFSQATQDPRRQLELLLFRNGMSGSIVPRPSFGGDRVNVVSGV